MLTISWVVIHGVKGRVSTVIVVNWCTYNSTLRVGVQVLQVEEFRIEEISGCFPSFSARLFVDLWGCEVLRKAVQVLRGFAWGL